MGSESDRISVIVRRLFVEKKKGFDIAGQRLLSDLRSYLHLTTITGLRICIRYDVQGIDDAVFAQARSTIFSEPPVDIVYDEHLVLSPEERSLAIEYLPGQYDQRADSAAQCIQLLTHGQLPLIQTAQVIVIKGPVTEDEVVRIQKYLINPVDSRLADQGKPQTLLRKIPQPEAVESIRGFIGFSDIQVQKLHRELCLSMSIEDLCLCKKYFAEQESRDPTLAEIRMLDTYWSDHCRHTTFLTRIDDVSIAGNWFALPIQKAFEEYCAVRREVYDLKEKPQTLMDMATIGARVLRNRGVAHDVEISDEINACSIKVDADIDGKKEPWLVMFKNETHNHPTEIEPFGGAATCLGGAIRDPLSGRAYVYQAMRVTGAADPNTQIQDTIAGKLPQRRITQEAAAGFSSYGNQIGLATGIVSEIYHPGYAAKRMEIGAVIGAAPASQVIRAKPVEGDVIVLVGGRTGRDGCGGATGSSKSHTTESIATCGAEVQKGNPVTERKIQRLMRNPKVCSLIKRCNDFGAGGVCVAIGELARGIRIDLDAVPLKYEGLDGTELAISESQERMAVVLASSDVETFLGFAAEENLEATPVAVVTSNERVVMNWRGQDIINLKRDFLDTNGVQQSARVRIQAPEELENYFYDAPTPSIDDSEDLKRQWLEQLSDLNVCSQKGLVERFDSTIGAASVLMPFGGINQATPAQCMVAKLPVQNGSTTTGTMMAYGFSPKLSNWSPFHGAIYAVLESVAKVVASGGSLECIRLTLQEYFEKLGTDPAVWGKPCSALLGALTAQLGLGIPAIGGKDSMSGTFESLTVPPTLVAFAVCPVDVSLVISPEFKKSGSAVVFLPLRRNDQEMPDFFSVKQLYTSVTKAISNGTIISCHTVATGGIAAAVFKMAIGNGIGMQFLDSAPLERLFLPEIGSLIVEVPDFSDLNSLFGPDSYIVLGKTIEQKTIKVARLEIPLDLARAAWELPLEKVFPVSTGARALNTLHTYEHRAKGVRKSPNGVARPVVFIPVFPGTNCEYDTAAAFEAVGGKTDSFVFRNLDPAGIAYSVKVMADRIAAAQIIVLPGGFSAGDEPDGSGKFIAATFRNPRIKDAVCELLQKRDGLMLGICNGFQALVKLGLLPYGEIQDIDESSPTLTFNAIGRHVSTMSRTRISSVLSPWFSLVNVGDMHLLPISHGEGRFVANEQSIKKLSQLGQIAAQYVDCSGRPALSEPDNPNGSFEAIEAISSPDGRILGKMCHNERNTSFTAKNIEGNRDQRLFEAGINYFR